MPPELAPVMRPMGAFLGLTLIFIAAEYFYARLAHHDDDHDVHETAASLGVALGDVAMRTLTGSLAALPFVLLYRHRLFDIPMAMVWSWAALFLSRGLEVVVSDPSPGAREATAAHRGTGRLVVVDGRTYLLPTAIHCDAPSHPLANREFLFPYVAVVEAPEEEMPACFGQTLVVTAITEDADLRARLLASELVGRLNLGPIPTPEISWDQPHEGNLFELLYGRRAFQEV